MVIDMSKSLIKGLFRSIDAAEWELLDSFFHPDIIYERPGYNPMIGVDQLLHFYRYERVILCGRHELDGIIVADSQAACWGRFVGVAKDGASLNEGFADTYTFSDGLIVQRKSFFFRPAI
jgi:uncharacterized protein